MASRAAIPGPPLDAHLQFTNTNLGKELKMNGVIHTYNDLYREVEQADRLYEDREELSKDEDQYCSNMLLLKAYGLHRIAAKPEVFPCKDLFSHAINFCELEKGWLVSPTGTVAVIIGSVFRDLYKMPCLDMVYTVESTTTFFKEKDTVKEVLRGWTEDAIKIKRRPSIDYPILYFRKGVRIGMDMLNRLWGKADTNQVDQLWVPLLGFIIAQDKKPDFAEILSYNLHQIWKTTKEGNSFFMDSYVVDACCASLRFGHPQFPKWCHPSEVPIHVLFEPLYIYKYYCFIITICEYFYPMDHTIIKVEGVLIAPHKLPMHVLDRLVAFEVASQCLLGVAGRLGQPWPNLGRKWIPWTCQEKLSGECVILSIGFRITCWEYVLQRVQEVDDARREREDADDTEEALTRNILRGLPTRDDLIPDLPEATPVPPPKPVLIPSGIPDPAVAMPFPKLPKGGRSEWFAKQLAKAEATGGVVMKPPELILEYDKATSNLKKITKRRVRTGSQVLTIQMEENVLSLTHKRKRGAQSKELGDEELAVDPVSIVRSANRMMEEAMERMHLELVHGKDKVTAPSSMGVEITNSIRELYKSYSYQRKCVGQKLACVVGWEYSLGNTQQTIRVCSLKRQSLAGQRWVTSNKRVRRFYPHRIRIKCHLGGVLWDFLLEAIIRGGKGRVSARLSKVAKTEEQGNEAQSSEPFSTDRPIIEQIDKDTPMHDDERDQRKKGGRGREERKKEKRKKKWEKEERDPARENLWGFLQSRGLPENVLPDPHPILY
eukprot:Gb_39972 [translate_table: standard]